ncbi:MAG: hypothetical protein AVDCRST_MAG59-1460 [uncultured Thermomicrobiales bacterium]|uniref:Uncharacterized protein n=1 Tax=uncultured Thermomicrobiales bacterium TaxID=1645740 RepID=A0A6J4UDV9_9BACT|nr:MAG: hypothetical protein AVDCRST_MAG59-1460 [uncultured Thermomicrobiales bacterium]
MQLLLGRFDPSDEQEVGDRPGEPGRFAAEGAGVVDRLRLVARFPLEEVGVAGVTASGVRFSWLTIARRSLSAWLTRRRSRLAASRVACAASVRSVTSCRAQAMPRTAGSSIRLVATTASHRYVPLQWRRRTSACACRPG